MQAGIRHILAIAALLGAAGPAAAGADAPGLATASPRPAVVELFTSEGCSSCPPAEAYIGELAQRPDILALTFHVDYWDDLGWHDRYSSPAATRRQRAYAHALGLPSVFTPQAVVDGQGNFVGSDRASIGAALAAPRSGVPVSIAVAGGTLVVDIAGQPNAPPSEVLLVAYQRSAVTPIGRGENAGRTIRETNVVRKLQLLGQWNGSAQQYRASTASLPAAATGVAILIQPGGTAPMVGAGSVTLP